MNEIRIDGTQTIDKPLNLRGMRGAVVRGTGMDSVIRYTGDGPCVDMTGACYTTWENVRVVGQNASCGILLGRNEKGDSAGFHSFSRVFVEGRFSLASVVNVASECNVWRGCQFQNTLGGCLICTDEPRIRPARRAARVNIVSPLGPVGGCRNNCMQHKYDGCIFLAYGGESMVPRSVITLTCGVSEVNIEGCSFSAKTEEVEAVLRLFREADRADGGPPRNIRVTGCRCETAGARRWLWAEDRCGIIDAHDLTLVGNHVECRESVLWASSMIDNVVLAGTFNVRSAIPWASASGQRPLISVGSGSRISTRWNTNYNRITFGVTERPNLLYESRTYGRDRDNELDGPVWLAPKPDGGAE